MDLTTMVTVLPTAISATLYSAMHTTFFFAMRTQREPSPFDRRPRVSVLKPIAGVDDELRENLVSFAALDYPDYELLFGVASLEDEAVPILRAFLASHPELDARLVVTTPPRGDVYNPKVAQLIDLTKEASGDVLVVSDANVRVSQNYLRSLVGLLMQPGVGLVSSVIVGRGARSLGAAIENAQLGAFVAPSIVAAHHLLGRTITVGKSMAMRREDLSRLGGWEEVRGVLAEDDVMGQRFAKAGYEVALSLEPVENRNVKTSVKKTLERHARWALMRRTIEPLGFVGELLLSPFVVATLIALIVPSGLAYRTWIFALLFQWIGAWLSLNLAGSRSALFCSLLEPLRAAAQLFCWAQGLVSRRVCWRGNGFVVGRGSRLEPLRGRRQSATMPREA